MVQLRLGPFKKIWHACHETPNPPHTFIDAQVSGPFRRWRHEHHFIDQADGRCVMEDVVDWEAPLGALGRFFGQNFIINALKRVFAWRGVMMANDLQRHEAFSKKARLRVAISGSRGMVGRALCAMLSAGGYGVVPLVRHKPSRGEMGWDAVQGVYPVRDLQNIDAVIHLAGENIAKGRWNAERKRAIYASRVQSTRAIGQSLIRAWGGNTQHKPFLCASAIGFYGDRGDAILDENTMAGEGFLSQVVQDWENACQPVADAGIRVVNLRLGVVLSAAGGALQKMLLPFQMGLGGPLGHGRQWFSWVGLEDVLGAILFSLHTPSIQGPVNVTAPNPLSMQAFASHLGKVLRRPAKLAVPAWALRLAMGEMAQPLLMASQRVQPRHLIESGFSFLQPHVHQALCFALGQLSRLNRGHCD